MKLTKVKNPSFNLDKIIDSFEIDFSNGYYLGEILKFYGYFDDMSNFNKK